MSAPSPGGSMPVSVLGTEYYLLGVVVTHYRLPDALIGSPPAASGFPPSTEEMSSIARGARTLFPALSSGGETTATPHLPGDTAINPPPTPLFAGRPVLNSQ